MNKEDSTNTEYCPIEEATKYIGDFWNILILRALNSEEELRFNELSERITNVTSTTLSDRLKKLQKAGFIHRKQHDCIPPKVEYSLTDKGRDLNILLIEIEKFGNKWFSI